MRRLSEIELMSEIPSAPQRFSTSARLAAAALTLGAGALGAWCWLARAYYLEPLTAQAQDARHAVLRSAGSAGLLFGVLALALIAANLAYLLRRRAPAASRFGSLRAWLDLHVVTGLFSGGCVLLHSACTLRSAAGTVAALSLAIVLATGVVGRFVLARVPRTREGRELSLDEARARFEELRAELSHLGLPPLAAAAVEPRERRSTLAALARAVFGDAAARAEHRRYRVLLLERLPDPAQRRRIEPTLRRIVAEAQTLARLQELSALMASWRFLHRWLALVMVGTAACHVGIALKYARLAPWAQVLRGWLP